MSSLALITKRLSPFQLAQCFKRNFATNNLVEVKKNDSTGISVVSMNRPPVNSLNLELLVQLRESLEQVQKDGSKGAILTSTNPKIFSAGLDILEMYKPDMKRARDFWNELQETWLTLYSCKIPIAAAINGASPAGGCLLAISCEYRVFVEGKHEIGLNETKLGIVAPFWFRDVYISTIGYRQAELALLKGLQFSPEEALKINMVDELAVDQEDAINKCQKYIESFARIPDAGRYQTKISLRGDLINRLKDNREADTSRFLQFTSMPQVQAALGYYIQSLKKKN